jgi:hypothetical protein
MKDPHSPISNEYRTLVVGVSIGVGAIVGFFVFWVVFLATVSTEDVAGPLVASLLLSVVVFALAPIGYQFIGRICALQIDRTREATFGRTIEPLTKEQVVKLSMTSPFSIWPRHMWYFGVQFFDEQWATKSAQASETSSPNTPETHAT